jgi:hypothetical protein
VVFVFFPSILRGFCAPFFLAYFSAEEELIFVVALCIILFVHRTTWAFIVSPVLRRSLFVGLLWFFFWSCLSAGVVVFDFAESLFFLRERLCNVRGKSKQIMGSPGATIAAVASPEGVLEDLTGCLQGWKRKVCSTEFLSLSLSLFLTPSRRPYAQTLAEVCCFCFWTIAQEVSLFRENANSDG